MRRGRLQRQVSDLPPRLPCSVRKKCAETRLNDGISRGLHEFSVPLLVKLSQSRDGLLMLAGRTTTYRPAPFAGDLIEDAACQAPCLPVAPAT